MTPTPYPNEALTDMTPVYRPPLWPFLVGAAFWAGLGWVVL